MIARLKWYLDPSSPKKVVEVGTPLKNCLDQRNGVVVLKQLDQINGDM